MPRREDQFQTVHSEGAILPPDLLQRIATGEVEGLDPATYHLPSGTKTKEAITQAWTQLLKYWRDFKAAREALPRSDETGTVITNEKWLLPLFQELGYGRLTTAKSPEIDEKLYPIERFWTHVPIHLIGFKLSLDHRTKGARGAATAIPHSMVQEFLNRSTGHTWAFLSNGIQLRILRDNAALSRQAYVEFDLECMMDGEVYADFALLWLVCHQSRLEADKAENCWLERWSKSAQEQGTRMLDDLRVGVAKAIELLGRGFIAHPANGELIEKLQSGKLSRDDYYRQVLRIVYRLLFLFVAEDRGLLHPPSPQDARGRELFETACSNYDRFYSTRRLRDLAESYRGSKHTDLWHCLSLAFDALGRDEGRPALALPALGSFLWSPTAAPDLGGPLPDGSTLYLSPVFIRNEDLLDAVRALAFVEKGKVLRSVDYRNLGSEELGSVYESLLELHPDINVPGRTFTLSTAAGNERKTSGSYYTPDSLVQCLLDSALEPVVAEAIKGKSGKDAEQAILKLKICDPAVGSGHFLIAAAHRLARHLARARSGESEPSPAEYQHALRDVIGHCLYGVDLNPMAVELCKVSLWMEALEPGKPLSFLDHRIQVGNSLLGATPALLVRGIPNEAFEPIEGDDKAYCREFKNLTKDQRKGQQHLFFERTSVENVGNLAAVMAQLNQLPDETVAEVRTKEQRYADLVKSTPYESGRLLADAWCAAFVWKKNKTFDYPITERVYRDLEHNPNSLTPWMRQEIVRLAKQYQFFHWHLAFPDVFAPRLNQDETADASGWSGGFDIILGNPPWDRIRPEAVDVFALQYPDLLKMEREAKKSAIAKLAESDPVLHEAWLHTRFEDLNTTKFLKSSGRFPLSTTKNVNSYAVFQELVLTITAPLGRCALVIQSGIATDDINKALFRTMIASRRLLSLYDFENRLGLFPGVHRMMKFCLLVCAGTKVEGSSPPRFVFYALDVDELSDDRRAFTLTPAQLELLAPNTGLCPTFRSRFDAKLVLQIFKTAGVFVNDTTEHGNPWDAEIRRVFSVWYDSKGFATDQTKRTGEQWLRLYEAKLMHQFDHRMATYLPSDDPRKSPCEDLTTEQRGPDITVAPRFWVASKDVEDRLSTYDWRHPYLIGYRDITNAMNERTCIAAVLPRTATDDTIRIIFVGEKDSDLHAVLVANLNSFVLDYAARNTVAGTHLSEYLAKQLPLLAPATYGESNRICNRKWRDWIAPRVLELSYTATDLRGFAESCAYDGPAFIWDEDRRFQIRCELDAAFFHLYDIARDDVDYVMETFPIVKRKDVDKHGSYRTKETILAMYDAMAEATRTGKPYQTRLLPPPGPPTDAKGNFIPPEHWKTWPPHINPPRDRKAEAKKGD